MIIFLRYLENRRLPTVVFSWPLARSCPRKDGKQNPMGAPNLLKSQKISLTNDVYSPQLGILGVVSAVRLDGVD
jgi:hypothetical protein